ncbi:MAG TPA: ABC transporter ATP-binding protein [Candidatus Binatia bacterium]|nr:ABC transporter ATP-binding protein [Candidatus Binatia bacterium]
MIRAEEIRVTFRRSLSRHPVHALQGLTLDVRDGDFFALIGQNGAGKSTAMYCFLGLLKPTSGRVEVMGQVPDLGRPVYANIAYLPEEPHYHLYLTVEEAVRYYASLYGRRVSEKAIHDSLEHLGLAQFKNLRLSKCSKGMKQKVGIAQCLIHETKLLLLDEPTRGLDPIAVREFRETLREIHQRGATIVMNSHVLSEIEMLANRVAVIDSGRVVAQDELSNLLTADRESYSVTFEPNSSIPEYLRAVEKQGAVVRGVIPKEKLYDFMEFARSHALGLHECALKKTSLEEKFFKIVKGGEEPPRAEAAEQLK